MILLTGRIPSKKNSKMMVCRGARPMLLPSAKYKEWHIKACIEVRQQINKNTIGAVTGSILIKLYAPDKRASDLTNKAESIMDLLVDMGVIADDNWFVMHTIILSFSGIDVVNPRAEVFFL